MKFFIFLGICLVIASCGGSDDGGSFNCTTCGDHQTCNEAASRCDLNTGKCNTKDDCGSNMLCAGTDNHTCTPENNPCDNCETWEQCNLEGTACILKDGACNSHSDCADQTDQKTCGGTNNHTCIFSDGDTIYSIQTESVALNSGVKISGTITALINYGFWIQEPGDRYAAIFVYHGTENSEIEALNLSIGDSVNLQGKYIEYDTLSEISDPINVTKNSGNTPIETYQNVPPASLQKTVDVEPYESMLVEIKGELTVGTVTDDHTTVFYNSSKTLSFTMRHRLFTPGYNTGEKLIAIRGILDSTDSTYFLLPRDQNDFSEYDELCKNLSCGDREICQIENSKAVCVCDENDGFFTANDGTCVNPCLDFANPCSEPNKSICTPTGGFEGSVSCRCDTNYELNDAGNCIKIDCIKFRAMSANTTSGGDQSYDPGHGVRFFKAFQPEIIMVQEFNYKNNSDSSIRELVDKSFGENYDYSRGTGQIPNGIISKWPIIDSGAWNDPNISNRNLDWAIVDLPLERDLFVISVHLHTKPSTDQVIAAQVVANEVAKIKTAQPGKYYFIVGGDFNGKSAVANSGFGKDNTTGTTTFDVTGPHPVGENGNPNTNAGRNDPYDWVLAGTDLTTLQKPLIIPHPVDSNQDLTYNHGLVFDSRIYTQSQLDAYFSFTPADEYGYSSVQVDDSRSANMQHMAVIKYFSTCSN